MSALLDVLPHVTGSLNATCLILLITGYVLIRRKRIRAHRAVMISAFGVSITFLACYVTHHYLKGTVHTRWEAVSPFKYAYYAVLLTHVPLAACVPVLALVTIILGLKRRDALHRRWARVTWPIWMYVSITGIIVYLMMYHLHPLLLSMADDVTTAWSGFTIWHRVLAT